MEKSFKPPKELWRQL